MRNEIRPGSLMLSLIRGARIDAYAGNPSFMRTGSIM